MYCDYKLVEKTKELHAFKLISKVREKEKRLRSCIGSFFGLNLLFCYRESDVKHKIYKSRVDGQISDICGIWTYLNSWGSGVGASDGAPW